MKLTKVRRSLSALGTLALILAVTTLVCSAQTRQSSESIPHLPRVLPTPVPGSSFEKFFEKKKQSTKTRPRGAFPGNIELKNGTVVFPVTVLNQEGVIVEGLRKTDVSVFLDGIAKPLISLTTDSRPWNVIIVIDTKAWTVYPLPRLKELVTVITSQFGAEDRLIFVKYNKTYKQLSELTADPAAIKKAINSFRLEGRDSCLFDTLEHVYASVAPSIQGPKALILISDGYDNKSSSADHKSVLSYAERSDMIAFPVFLDNAERNLRSLSRGSGPWIRGGVSASIASETLVSEEEQELARLQYGLGRSFMNDLVFITGGRAIHAGILLSDQKNSSYNIAQQLRRQYYLTLPAVKPDLLGTRQQIKVRVNRPNLAVLSRGSYILTSNTVK